MARADYKAEKIGAFVHDLMGEGEIVSGYSRAWNIRCRDGLLISVVQDISQMTSLSLTAPHLFQNSETDHRSIRLGEAVRVEKDWFIINGLRIDLRGGKPWDGIIHSEELEGFTLHKLPLMKQALLSEGNKEGLLAIIGSGDRSDPFVSKALNVLNQIQFTGIEPRMIRGLSPLVGLGMGLTPSGDDFIAGALLGEDIMGKMPGLDTKPCQIDKGEIRGALLKTNGAGRTLLWLCLKGHFPSYLTEVLRRSARAQDFEEMRKAFSHAVVQGETSGTDALAGLVWYLGKSTNNR